MLDSAAVLSAVRGWAADLGFQQAAVARVALADDAARVAAWVASGAHGDMHYLERNQDKREDPRALVPDTLSVISLRMNYMSASPAAAWRALARGDRAYVARYALGRDYHKTVRGRLRALGERLRDRIGPFGYRVLCDSAPVLERALARDGGLGWIGKHTNLVNREDGSLFVLGEIFTDLPLEPDIPVSADHCGSCTRCLAVCPTAAIVAPYRLDARRCISYLTIEHRGSIPLELRPLLGNRIFGCDDCQLVCPWNRYAKVTPLEDFAPRNGLDGASLTTVFAWSPEEFDAAPRCAGCRTSSGCATSPSRWAMRRAVRP
jgi:epoxyqueuosine reductase